ncbi:MAG: DUF6036 family nucleotidyltransferase, partial [Pseudobdellovibrionaceae bacterium]
IVERVSEELTGEWIIIGGTVLPLVGIDYRVTVDVDIISFGGADNQSQLGLMNIAAGLNLPVETINQAGGFFLQKVSGWQQKVKLIRKGTKSSVYRPNLELYFILKLARLSASDMEDCLEYYKWSKKHEEIDTHQIASLVQTELNKENSKEKKSRLEKLLKAIK